MTILFPHRQLVTATRPVEVTLLELHRFVTAIEKVHERGEISIFKVSCEDHVRRRPVPVSTFALRRAWR